LVVEGGEPTNRPRKEKSIPGEGEALHKPRAITCVHAGWFSHVLWVEQSPMVIGVSHANLSHTTQEVSLPDRLLSTDSQSGRSQVRATREDPSASSAKAKTNRENLSVDSAKAK
jgi:hypothetical protein